MFKPYIQSNEAVTAIEYALIGAGIAIVLVVSLALFSEPLANIFASIDLDSFTFN